MSTPLFVNEFGSMQAGFDGEEKRREESRLQKRKALQELADQAASQGKQLDPETWFQMAQDTIGAGALYGDAPSSAILEGVRANANAKAQQVAQKQKYDAALQQDDLDNRLRTKIGEMARSDSTETDIYEHVRDTYGDELAKRYKPRISAYMTQASVADEDTGMRLGGALQSSEEAENYIKQRPGLSRSVQQGIRNQARMNEDRNDAAVSQVANKLASNGGFADDAATRDWVLSELPPALRWSPNANEFVNRAMTAARGGSGVVQRQQDNAVTQAFRGAYAQSAPQAAATFTNFAVQERQQLEKNIAEATRKVQEFAADKVNRAIAPFGDISKIKDKGKQAIYADATDFLRQYDLPEEMRNEIVSAAASGDTNKLAALKQSALKVGVPMSEIFDATKKVEMFKAGQLSGSVPQMFGQVAFVSQAADDRIMAARGQNILQLFQRDPRDSAGLRQAQVKDAVDAVVRDMNDTRSTLLTSGVFSANAADIAQMEREAVRRKLQPLAAASRIPAEQLDQLVSAVLQRLPPPSDINGRPSLPGMFNNAVQGGFNAINQQPPGAPANQWWRQR